MFSEIIDEQTIDDEANYAGTTVRNVFELWNERQWPAFVVLSTVDHIQ